MSICPICQAPKVLCTCKDEAEIVGWDEVKKQYQRKENMIIITKSIQTNKIIDNLVREYGCRKMATFLSVSPAYISEVLKGTRTIKKELYLKILIEIKRKTRNTLTKIKDNL